MSNQVFVNSDRLKRLQSRPPLHEYLRDIWGTRNFTYLNAKSRANQNGAGTFLGGLWVILDPLLQTVFYGFIFGMVLKVSRGMDNFPGFLALGIVFFRIITRGLASGSGIVRKSRSLISSFQFPRASVVIGETLKNALDALVPATVAVVLATLWQPEFSLSWSLLTLLPIFVLIQLFSLGCCFIVARATAFVPDLRSIVNLLTRALFFLSGVFFSIERFVNHSTLELVMKLNPVYQFLTAVRQAVLDSQTPSVETWCYLFVWSFGLVAVGFIYFWEAEGRYASIR